MIVQIYSMTSVDDAVASAEAGADLVGVVVGDPEVLAEAISSDAARAILEAVRPRARGVALSLSDNREEICAMVDAVQPDIVIVMPCGYDAEIAHREAEMHRDQLATLGAAPLLTGCRVTERCLASLTDLRAVERERQALQPGSADGW